ncbi:glycosyltransferase WbsX family protein [Paenibacillus roseipurpureus]|uniref:Glycoside hydrolase family 99-like domain-containing protein n=1 Tax=Paenibacillus roseopurpureus TaxID=2918901 RepID=A0AA96RLR8_9BACL|nr:glycoside hydrolase family 99-like domain-containing protein [Paenibacillus sp. MBLB1832]WNR45965.1 glycoside hydrolase family 99-like domain-containing protein [Paenibacillus sp. MBLB1832]
MKKEIEVAVYYFPNYHVDSRNESWHGKGWTEWELVKAATPRFEGHQQPKIPLWGYLDESDPAVAEKQITAAADHAIDVFIYDWYWYSGGPFLNAALEKGFMQATNNNRLKFSLMWANHDWVNLFPLKRSAGTHILEPGAVTRKEFEKVVDYLIEQYFKHPSYWRVKGGLYFSFYDLQTFIDGLGGLEQTIEALAYFRTKVRDAGLGELHLNAIVVNIKNLPSERALKSPNDIINSLGMDSVTSYVWIHNVALDTFPAVKYSEYAQKASADWGNFRKQFEVPYFPNVSMGWDSSPRTVQSDVYDHLDYPYMPVLIGNTPEEFEKSLQASKTFLEQSQTLPAIITVNSWNEWTEGSYLEPDTVHGLGYLEAIRRTFGENITAEEKAL